MQDSLTCMATVQQRALTTLQAQLPSLHFDCSSECCSDCCPGCCKGCCSAAVQRVTTACMSYRMLCYGVTAAAGPAEQLLTVQVSPLWLEHLCVRFLLSPAH